MYASYKEWMSVYVCVAPPPPALWLALNLGERFLWRPLMAAPLGSSHRPTAALMHCQCKLEPAADMAVTTTHSPPFSL